MSADSSDPRFAFLGWNPAHDITESDRTPVTFLSGFLGAGKSSLLRHLLRNTPGGRFALVVNDVGDVNIDAEDLRRNFPDNTGAVASMRALTQGCICCSIGNELADALIHLRETQSPAHILVEGSGVSSPQNLLQTLCQRNLFGRSVLDAVRVHNMVTVVDAAVFLREWRDLRERKRRRAHILFVDPRRPLVELMMEQVETADILLINKTDLLTPADLRELTDVLRGLNPRAEIDSMTEGEIDTSVLLDRARFDFRDTQCGSALMQRLGLPGKTTAHHASFGLDTFTFHARRPFRSRDFFRVLRGGLTGVVRAKGYYWTAEKPQLCGMMSLAGNVLRADYMGKWYAALLEEGKPRPENLPVEIAAHWIEGPGDRRQEIVLIGVDLDAEGLRLTLEACLD